jgi:hypothetical protein
MENQGKTKQQMKDSYDLASIGIIGALISLLGVVVYELLF